MTNEHDIQNQIRAAISQTKAGVCFRTNVGEAWTGTSCKLNFDGTRTLTDPRRFQSGLPNGFSDLLCIVPVTITPDMVGQTIAQAGFVEVKTATGKIRPEQNNFLSQMRKLGARAGVARSPEEAIQILRS